jgi:hypothetical protein
MAQEATINDRIRELARLSVLVSPQMQFAPAERQLARHRAVSDKPLHESLPALSPMEHRQREAQRLREIEVRRDALRDSVVREIEDKYLNGDASLLFPERSLHNDLHKIQFPMKPFLPVEVADRGEGLANFPPYMPTKTRCRKSVPAMQRRGEVKGIFAEATAQQFASERSPAEREELARRIVAWRKRRSESQRAVPVSIFAKEFDNVRSGASSIETKRGVPKLTSLVPLSGMSAADATRLGPLAPFGPGRAIVLGRLPQVAADRERAAAATAALRGSSGSARGGASPPRTEYQQLVADTEDAARARALPVRGTYFRPDGRAPRLREVHTHDGDVLEQRPRELPMPPTSPRRVQIVSSSGSVIS